MSKGRTTGPFKVTHQSQSASAKGKSAPWHADAVARTSSAVTIATGGCAKLRPPAAGVPRRGVHNSVEGTRHGCRGSQSQTHFRVRRDKVDITGTITLRHNSRPHHIGLGRRLIGTRVLVLVADRDVRVLSEDGELIRRLTLDPARDYQPHGGS